MRAASVALRDLVDQPHPVQRARLAAARWRVARALLRYLPLVDRVVYTRLRLHRDRSATAIADKFAAEAETIYAMFESHAFRWTPDAVEQDWAAYRAAVRNQANLVQNRFDREQAEMLPYLMTAPDVPSTRSPNHRNWAADGWKFRDLLGLDDTASAAVSG